MSRSPKLSPQRPSIRRRQPPPRLPPPRRPPLHRRGRSPRRSFNESPRFRKPTGGLAPLFTFTVFQPICDLRQGGETKYLVKYSQPLEDENPLMIDYGSGRYRLQLVHRKPAADKADAIDTAEIEIYNPKYPPKIPRSVWMNDPRNDRWAALLPKEEPPAPATGLGTLTEAFKTFSDIRRDVREEIAPPPRLPFNRWTACPSSAK